MRREEAGDGNGDGKRESLVRAGAYNGASKLVERIENNYER